MTTASVAVIGGGVMGASVAYHLAARGWRDVVILERGAGPGEGSTGRATGGFRAQYATAINVRLSLLAREKLCRFEAETGVDPGYAPCGYLWIGADERELAELRDAQRVQHAEGLREAVAAGPRGRIALQFRTCRRGHRGRRVLPERRLHPSPSHPGGVPRGRRATRRAGSLGRRGHRLHHATRTEGSRRS